MPILDMIMELLAKAGAERYGMEPVSQLEHALQCAMHAERMEAPPALIAACLLHDIGHLVDAGDEGLAERGIDACHEEIAANWLAQYFSAAVVQPVRLHVNAKRYLCQAEPQYWAGLSQASKTSLEVQGGIYSVAEAEAFIAQPYAADAVMLRRWDDAAKSPRLHTPDLTHYRPILAAALQ
ncbi:phosphonate degradation HD-domain oxygenase [Ferrovibrio sp.]|uniref:phosphonate degradation HD-domain oxygenase n=1 Tax=Ferrovibrio sp. TaxID=1917215 RepID=UPI001B453D03|nr:phosphonate degradation HD-domain oxygenase [Ferrovibrio sp.]MBP7063170.1 HD domain-containing protein [Ferrovibrio sp.]